MERNARSDTKESGATMTVGETRARAEARAPQRIMYVCEACEGAAPEGCGYFDHNRLRVLSTGMWVCENCFEDFAPENKPVAWRDLKPPPEYVSAAALIAAEQRGAPQWQPIETAPKDGTGIVGWDPDLGEPVLIYWRRGKWLVRWDDKPNPDCTHWQPLPAGPEVAK